MTETQYERWKQFSLALAECGFTATNGKRLPSASTEYLVGLVVEFFEILESNWTWGYLRLVESWDSSERHPTDRDGFGRSEHGPYICDDMDRVCDEHLQLNTLWADRLHCCVRVGIDVAVAPSGGVIGFTAGDIRRVWAGKVPDWVQEYFQTPLDEFEDDTPVWL